MPTVLLDSESEGLSDAESRASVPIAPQDFQPTEYPVTIWVAGRKVTPGLVDTVSNNMRIFLNALAVPVVAVLYYNMRCTSAPGETSHLFIAVDENQRVIRVSPARLCYLTGMIDAVMLKQYTASLAADPLGALLLKAGGSEGERINRFPPIFGFKAPKGEKQVYDRLQEIDALRRDGYIGLTFLPVAGVDHRMQLAMEIASLWGYAIASQDQRWPDLLLLRNETADDLGGVPDETWLHHALSRVQEDHLPVVELDGLWMGSLPGKGDSESRARVLYAVLDWLRMRRLPYITARTFHCYVRRDLSVVVALGSLRDRSELIEWLELYPFHRLGVAKVKGETRAATAVFSARPSNDIALKESGTDTWIVVHNPESTSAKTVLSEKEIEKALRSYYTDPTTCSGEGSPLRAPDFADMKFADLLKVVRVAECEAAVSGICMLSGLVPQREGGASWLASHRAYRSAVRSQVLRSHDTLGIYRTGPFASPFFSSSMTPFLPDTVRFRPVVSEISLAPDIGKSEDELLKALMGTVWLLSVQESPANVIDIMYVSSDREGEQVRRVLFDAWKSGHLIGTWCRVLLTHRDTLSISAAGGSVDPLVAHAGDSVVDGNRWLDLTKRALSECTSS